MSNIRIIEYENKFLKACKDKDYEVIQKYLHYFDVYNFMDEDGRTPAHYFATYSDSMYLETIIFKGCRLHYKDNIGLSPYHMAILNNQIHNLKVMEDTRMIDIYDRTHRQSSCLHLAAYQGSIIMVKKFVYMNGMKDKNLDGKTPLDIARERGHVHLYSILL